MTTHFSLPIKGNKDSKIHFLRDFPIGDPSRVAMYFNDFTASQDYAAADWVNTTTEAGAGSATEALSAQELGGALVITNDDADNDSVELQQSSDGGTTVLEQFSLASGKNLWFAARFKVSDADQCDLVIGLNITDTAIVDGTTDSLSFRLADGSGALTAVAEKDSTETSLAVATMTDAAYVEVAMHYDGNGKVHVYSRNSTAGQEDKFDYIGELASNLPDDEKLALSVAFQNGEAAAKALTIDYLFVAQDRN
jgi:hypothetical protein